MEKPSATSSPGSLYTISNSAVWLEGASTSLWLATTSKRFAIVES
jgi:hypothetical protein